MRELVVILAASWLAGLASFIGGLIARYEGSAESAGKRELIHGVVAFGGGILVAAVAFALVPAGMKHLGALPLALTFCAGGAVFCGIDIVLSRSGGSKAQFMAMMMDFVPEAMALGAVFGSDRRLGLLLAAFIGAQNLPEGFNAFREIRERGTRPRRALGALLVASLAGPIAAGLGYTLLQDHFELTAGIMTFAAAGILYLIFQDIAPQSTMRRRRSPPLGAVLGFLVGMMGKKLIG
jgi:ZIP family zinc transporter